MTPRRKRRILLLQNPSGGMGSFHLNYTASPPQLNFIPTSFCLTRDSHSAKLRSFPHKTPRGQKWWMGWMSPGFIFLWKEGALVAAPNFSLSKTFCSSPKPLGDWRHHQSKPDNPTTSQPWSELMEKSSCCRCWCDKCCSGSVQSPSPPQSHCSGSWTSIRVWNLSILKPEQFHVPARRWGWLHRELPCWEQIWWK